MTSIRDQPSERFAVNGEAWRRIARDPDLIARYNELKLACEGRSVDEYDVAKRELFYSHFEL